MIRVLIVHENPLFRVGLRSVLKRHEELQIVGVVSMVVELEQLLELTTATRPDVVLFDGALTSCQPMYSAAEAVDRMRRAGACGIMVLAPLIEEEALFHFMVSGAAAYEPATISGNDLVEKIQRVANGEYLITSAVLQPTLSKPSQQKTPAVPCKQVKQARDPSKVSDREITILKQIMKGRSNKQTALALKLCDQTVKNHITSILKKFHVHDRTAAVVIALRRNLISFDDIDSGELVLDQEAFARRTQHFNHRSTSVIQLQTPSPYALAANG